MKTCSCRLSINQTNRSNDVLDVLYCAVGVNVKKRRQEFWTTADVGTLYRAGTWLMRYADFIEVRTFCNDFTKDTRGAPLLIRRVVEITKIFESFTVSGVVIIRSKVSIISNFCVFLLRLYDIHSRFVPKISWALIVYPWQLKWKSRSDVLRIQTPCFTFSINTRNFLISCGHALLRGKLENS